MELFILKNGQIHARVAADDETANYSIVAVNELPNIPEETLGIGEEWQIQFDESGQLTWVKTQRSLTQEEKIKVLECANDILLGVEQ